MLCPCCAGPIKGRFDACSCGARAVGFPQTDSIVQMPSLKQAMLGFVFASLGAACYFSKFLILFSLIGFCLSLTTLRGIKKSPQKYGGYKLALTGIVSSGILIVAVFTIIGFEIPRWWNARQEIEIATTRARMLEISIASETYRQKHGAFPAQLSDLYREQLLSQPTLDFWEEPLHYVPTAQLAVTKTGKNRTASIPVFNQYNLVSAGWDGKLNTSDDIILHNNMFMVFDRPSTIIDD